MSDLSCPSDGFADTLDLDLTNTPNESLPAVEPAPPRRNPSRDYHPPTVTVLMSTAPESQGRKSVVTDIFIVMHVYVHMRSNCEH